MPSFGAAPTAPSGPAPWALDLATLEPERCQQGLARAARAPEPADALALHLYDTLAAPLGLPRPPASAWRRLGLPDAVTDRSLPPGERALRRAAWVRAEGPPSAVAALPPLLAAVLRDGPDAVLGALPEPEPLLVLTPAERDALEAEEAGWVGRFGF